MTDQGNMTETPPPTPWYKKWWGVTLIAVLAIGIIGSIGGGGDEADGDTAEIVDPATTITTEATTTTEQTTTTTQPTTTTTEVELGPDDFLVELFIVEDQCFGTAGALVTVEPELVYMRFDDYPGGERLLVYSITGGEYGVETYNLTIHDDGSYTYNQELVSTASCNYNLEVEVVGLRNR